MNRDRFPHGLFGITIQRRCPVDKRPDDIRRNMSPLGTAIKQSLKLLFQKFIVCFPISNPRGCAQALPNAQSTMLLR